RRTARPVLAGRAGVCRDVARHRLHLALLLAGSFGRSLRDADISVVVRPRRAGIAVRGADLDAVLHPPRKHQAAAGGDGRTDRREVVTRHSGARVARARNPYSRSWLWIPGLRQVAHPGMTKVKISTPLPQILPRPAPARPRQTA